MSSEWAKGEALPNGTFVVGGYIKPAAPEAPEIAVVACMNSKGDTIWEKRYPGSPFSLGLRVSDLAVRPNGVVQVTAIGNSGLLLYLDPATGNTLTKREISTPTVASALDLDGTAFFASRIDRVFYLYEGPRVTKLTDHSVVSYRISNTLQETAVETPAGRSIAVGDGISFLPSTTYEPAQCRWIFGNHGVYLVFGSAKILSDTYMRPALRINAVSYDTSGVVKWISSWDRDLTYGYYRIYSIHETSQYADMMGSLHWTFTIHDSHPRGSPKTYHLVFSNLDGAITENASDVPGPTYHRLIAQNGSYYAYGLSWTGTPYSVGKYDSENLELQWYSSSYAVVCRLPFLVINNEGYGTGPGTSMVFRRQHDSGEVADESTVSSKPETLYALVVNSITGDGLMIGSTKRYHLRDGRLVGYDQAMTCGISQEPIAIGDRYSSTGGTALHGNVLANDRFAPGAVSTVVQGPSNGALVMRNDGSFTYTPRVGASSDSFAYQVYRNGVPSGRPASSEAKVFIKISP